MNYEIKYRGGPNNGKRATISSLVNEIDAYKIKFSPMSFMADDPWAPAPTYTRGVYSRVFTPTKKGVYLYVWVEK